MITIKGIIVVEKESEIDEIGNGYLVKIEGKDEMFIKQDGKLKEFDKSLLTDMFSTKKVTKSKSEA